MTPARLRLLAYAGLYFFWGTTFLGIRIAERQGMPPFLLASLRHGSAGLIFLAYAKARGLAWPSRREILGALGMGVAFLAVANGTCTWAIQSVESGYATLMIGAVPLLTLAYASLVHGQRVGAKEWALLALGLAGVALLLSPQAALAHATGWAGVLGLGGAALVWAATMVEKRRIPQPSEYLLSTGFQMLGGGLVLGVVCLLRERPWAMDWAAISHGAWAAWAYLVVFGSCVGYGAFSFLLRQDPPQLVGTYAYVNPMVALLAGHWILGEALSPTLMASALLIISSVAGILFLERP